MRPLHVPQGVDEHTLNALFQHCGTVTQIRLAGAPDRPSRFAFIEFSSPEQAQQVRTSKRGLGLHESVEPMSNSRVARFCSVEPSIVLWTIGNAIGRGPEPRKKMCTGCGFKAKASKPGRRESSNDPPGALLLATVKRATPATVSLRLC